MLSQVRGFLFLKGTLLLLAGFVFIFWPEAALKGVTLYMGIFLVLIALIAFWIAYRVNKESGVNILSMIGPVMLLIAGLVLLILPEFALILFSLSAGIWILVDGLIQIKIYRGAEKAGINLGPWLLVMGLISVVISVVVFLNPYEFVKLLTILFGITMLLSGGFMLFLGFAAKVK